MGHATQSTTAPAVCGGFSEKPRAPYAARVVPRGPVRGAEPLAASLSILPLSDKGATLVDAHAGAGESRGMYGLRVQSRWSGRCGGFIARAMA